MRGRGQNIMYSKIQRNRQDSAYAIDRESMVLLKKEDVSQCFSLTSRHPNKLSNEFYQGFAKLLQKKTLPYNLQCDIDLKEFKAFCENFPLQYDSKTNFDEDQMLVEKMVFLSARHLPVDKKERIMDQLLMDATQADPQIDLNKSILWDEMYSWDEEEVREWDQKYISMIPNKVYMSLYPKNNYGVPRVEYYFIQNTKRHNKLLSRQCVNMPSSRGMIGHFVKDNYTLCGEDLNTKKQNEIYKAFKGEFKGRIQSGNYCLKCAEEYEKQKPEPLETLDVFFDKLGDINNEFYEVCMDKLNYLRMDECKAMLRELQEDYVTLADNILKEDYETWNKDNPLTAIFDNLYQNKEAV